MKFEFEHTRTEKGTNLIEGSVTVNTVINYIKEAYKLERYKIQIHLVQPELPSPRTESLYVSLRVKTNILKAIGAQPVPYIHPSKVTLEEFREYIISGNEDPNTVGIILQMPLPSHLDVVRSIIDFTKDIDSLNPHNDTWRRCATAEAALRVLAAYNNEKRKIGLVGANGFIGRDIGRGIQENDLGQLVSVEFDDSLDLLESCQTIVSAVGEPNLIQGSHLGKDAYLGIDVGNTRRNREVLGDFDFKSVDGKIRNLTSVPHGMGPLEMAVIAERVVQNTVDPNFKMDFSKSEK